jgi:hypothetical protein
MLCAAYIMIQGVLGCVPAPAPVYAAPRHYEYVPRAAAAPLPNPRRVPPHVRDVEGYVRVPADHFFDRPQYR